MSNKMSPSILYRLYGFTEYRTKPSEFMEELFDDHIYTIDVSSRELSNLPFDYTKVYNLDISCNPLDNIDLKLLPTFKNSFVTFFNIDDVKTYNKIDKYLKKFQRI